MKTKFALVALWALTAVSAVRAQNLDILKVIPASADAYAIAGKLSDFEKKVAALTKRLGVPAPPLLQTATAATGIGEGVDKNGPAAAIVFAAFGEKPVVVGVLRVTDFAKVVKSTDAKDDGDGVYTFALLTNGMPMSLAKKGNYALITPAEDKKSLLSVMKSAKEMTAAKPLETWLAAQDIAVVVPEKSLRTYAMLGAKMIPDEIPGVPPEQQEQLKGQIEWARGLLDSLSKEGTYLAIGGRIDAQENVQFGFRAGYTEGGRFGKNVVSPKVHPLAGLPADPYAMAMGASLSTDWLKALLASTADINKAQYNLSDAEMKELTKLMEDNFKGVEAASFGLQLPKGKAPLFSGAVGVFKVADAKEYLKSYAENISKSNKLMKIKGTSTAMTLGAFPAVEMTYDAKSIVKNEVPDADRMMEKFFGSDKITATLVAVDAKTVLMGYVPATKMKAVAASYATRTMLTADPMTAKTLKLLPENPTIVALFSPRELVTMIVELSPEFGGPALPIPIPDATPPLGFGSRADSSSVEMMLVLPGEIFSEIGRLIRQSKEL